MNKRQCDFDITANATSSSGIDIEVCVMYKSNGNFDYFRLDFGPSLSVCLTRMQMAKLYENIAKVNVNDNVKQTPSVD